MHTEHFTGRTPGHRALPLLALLGAALLAACGGNGGEGSEDFAAAAGTIAYRQAIPALLDDEGRAMPSDPRALPADTGARTRAGQYATAVQAEQLERAMKTAAISTQVDSGGDAATAADLAVLTVYGLQAAHELSHDAPVLVRSADLRLAATVANRLQDNGFTRVFLVTR